MHVFIVRPSDMASLKASPLPQLFEKIYQIGDSSKKDGEAPPKTQHKS
jgi:hypothetical protein